MFRPTAPAHSPLSRTAVGLGAAVLLLGLSACGSSSTDTSSSAPTSAAPSSAAPSSAAPSSSPSAAASSPAAASSAPEAAEVVITIKDYKYDVPDSVAPGAKITIKNEDDVSHTVTARTDKAFDVMVPGMGTATLTAPDKAGSFDFYCLFHSNMESTLKVA